MEPICVAQRNDDEFHEMAAFEDIGLEPGNVAPIVDPQHKQLLRLDHPSGRAVGEAGQKFYAVLSIVNLRGLARRLGNGAGEKLRIKRPQVEREAIEGQPGRSEAASESRGQPGIVEFVAFVSRKPFDDFNHGRRRSSGRKRTAVPPSALLCCVSPQAPVA